MNPLGSVNPITPRSITPLGPDELLRAKLPKAESLEGAAPGGFGDVLDGLVKMVDTKQNNAAAVTQRVLLGDSAQLHQSVIAMQEASVAFTLMVEVRNKLVESYQELMRLQV